MHLLLRCSILLSLFISTSAFAQNAVLKGIVTDDTGKPITDIAVSIKGTSIGIQTDIAGEFLLRVPSDSAFVLVFNSLSYQSKSIRLKLKAGEVKLIKETLKKSTIDIGTVIIEDKATRGEGITRIDPKISSTLPNASGSFEAILKTLPGVSSNNELSSQYSVRGGNYDENLVYVNDIEIYRPQLVRSGQQEGLSFINSEMVSGIRFSSGGFDAKYGDKLSSVLDITYKKPKRTAATVIAGLQGNAFTLEGTTKNYRLNYLIGLRQKTNRSLLNTLDVKGDYTPFFVDAQSYISFAVSPSFELGLLSNFNSNKYTIVPQDRSTTFGTFGQVMRLDVFYEGQEIDRFESLMSGLIATYKPNNNLQLKLTTSAFDITESEAFDIEGSYLFSDVESDFGKANFGQIKAYRGIGSYMNHARNYLYSNIYNAEHKGIFSSKKHTLSWGTKWQTESTRDNLSEWNLIDSAGYSIPDASNQLLLKEVIKSKNSIASNRYSAYFQDNISLSDSGIAYLTLGIRSNYWDYNNELLISPRATFAFIPRNWKRDFLFRVSSGIYSQPPFFREFRDLTGKLNPNIKAQRSIHYVVASDYTFKALGNKTFKFTTELYYKQLSNLIPYEVDNVRIRYYANNNAKGYATGVDFRLNGEFVEGLESWFSLSLLQTKEDIIGDFYEVKDENDSVIARVEPGFIPRPTDQRVNFSIFFQDKLLKNPSFKVHLTLTYGSGLPFGPPDFNRYKDTLRIPSYKRVDIGFSKEFISPDKRAKSGIFKVFKSLTAYAEVFNLLQVSNTISYLWIRDVNQAQYAIPNYLTGRQLNLRLVARF